MPNAQRFRSSVISSAVIMILLCLRTGPVRAQNNSLSYTFALGLGFVCSPDDSGNCPAITKSANGDTYELTGAGAFDAQNKSVRAAGIFAHKSSSGHVLETGIWTARELLSFVSYGISPHALLREGNAPGPPQFAPNRLAMLKRPMPTGGLATFRITLMSTSGATRTAVLEVNCALGQAPSERSVDGIRLAFHPNATDFSEEAGGRAVFLATPPQATASASAAPAPQPKTQPSAQ